MKFDFLKAARIAATIVGAVVPGVSAVEQIASGIFRLKGKDKQDAVVDLVKASLAAAEGLTAHDLANDHDVEVATRAVVDAVVALHQVIASKQAAAIG